MENNNGKGDITVKTRSPGGRIACLFLVMIGMLGIISLSVPLSGTAAVAGAITDIALSYGSDAPAALEKQGMSPLLRPLCGSGESAVCLGCERGGSAPVTGLVLSRKKADSLTVGGITYSLVSQTSVTQDEQTYLYLTRDASAGAPLTAITLTGGSGYEDKPLYALSNDGTVPLRFDDGAVADFGDSNSIYLNMLYQNVCRPYIRSIFLTFGADKRAAVENAAAQGCEYYYDGGLTDAEGKISVVGFVRTADEAGALRSIVAVPVSEGTPDASLTISGADYHLVSETAVGTENPCLLYASNDAAAGNPIVNLTSSAIPARSTDVLGKMCEKLFVKTASPLASYQAKSESLYRELVNSREPLANVPVVIKDGEDSIATPLAYTCLADGLSADLPVPVSETQPPEKEVLVLEGQAPGETIVDDFDPDTYLEQKPEVIASAETPVAVASIFGKGRITDLLIILALTIVGAGAGAVMFRMRKRKERNGDAEK